MLLYTFVSSISKGGFMAIKAHDPLLVAEYLLKKAESNQNPLTPMQVLKLVYMAHGWMLGIHGRSLINEPVLAWQYGPVVVSVYEQIKKFKNNHVELPIASNLSDAEFDAVEMRLMDQVVDIYGKYSGPALSRMTHSEGTPWSIIWNKCGWNGVINTNLIQGHYSKRHIFREG